MIIRKLPKRDKGYCGAGFFTTPLRRFNPFHRYCKAHDLGYYISEQEYAKAVIEKDPIGKCKALERKIIADMDFYRGCRKRARESWWITRPTMILWSEGYIKAVKTFSEEVWWASAHKFIAKFQKMKDQGIELVVMKGINSKKYTDLEYRLSILHSKYIYN